MKKTPTEQQPTMAEILDAQAALAKRRAETETELEAERARLAAAHRHIAEQRRPLFVLLDQRRLTVERLGRARRDRSAVAAVADGFAAKIEASLGVETEGPNVALFELMAQGDPVGASADRYLAFLDAAIRKLQDAVEAMEAEAVQLADEMDALDLLEQAGIAPDGKN